MKTQLLTILTITMFAFFYKAQAQDDYSLVFNSADEQRLRYLTTEDDILDTKLNGATDYTIEAWVKPTSASFHGTVILKRWDQFALTLYQDANKRFYFTHYASGGNTFVNSTNNAFTLNEWNHIVVICNSATNSVKLYANGVDVTSSTQTALTLNASPSAANFYLGYGGSGTYFTGEMDKVRIKNTAETIGSLQDEITDTDYVTDANTAVLYNFKEGSSTVTENEADSLDATLQCSAGNCTSETWWAPINDVLLSSDIDAIDFSLYPNPVVGKDFTVQTSSDESLLQIEIFDVLSKQVSLVNYTGTTTSTSVDVSGLATGIYYVKVQTSKGMGIKSIIIQ